MQGRGEQSVDMSVSDSRQRLRLSWYHICDEIGNDAADDL
jgi:hypothetical protein